MHLLLINPNTTAAITDRMAQLAGQMARPDTRITAVTGRFGARYVASRASYAVAGHAALDAYAAHGADADGVVLACFGDPALRALQEMAHQPVVGMAEASCLAACAHGGRFAIVTGGDRWRPMLEEFVGSIGLADRLAVVHTVAATGAEIAAAPEQAYALLADACVACVREHGAASVILGGAGLAGIAAEVAARVPVPIIDSLAASVRHAEKRVIGGHTHVDSFRASERGVPAIETVGLSTALGHLFERRRADGGGA